jgi:hypothetical protein
VSQGTARTVVMLTGLLMIAFVGIEAKRGTATGSTYKKIWAIGVLTLGLGAASDFVPDLVGPFALLVLLAAYARNQGALGSVIGGSSSTPAASTSAAAATGGSTTSGNVNTIGGAQ